MSALSLVDELWALLPAVYRQRDAEANQGGALRDLIEVLGEQADVVAEDLARLYDNWFIETCDPWVVPYIGDLVGARSLHSLGSGPGTPLPRAYVANTVAYRRRKGTPAVLEQLARDVTGWPARVVELFGLLGTTQHLNHRRLHNVRTPDLRRAGDLVALGGPFERATHLAEARQPPAGRYGIANLGVFIWRLEPFQQFRVSARAVSDPPDGRYHVDPTGLDVALVNPPLAETTITSLARERHVPGPLGRRQLFDELEARRAGRPVGPFPFFGPDPVLEVFADTGSGLQPLPPEHLTAADLSDPPVDLGVTTGWRRPAAPVVAAIDPVLGRLAFRSGIIPARVEVSYTCAFAGRVGAGPYERADQAVRPLLGAATFVRAVGAELPSRPGLVRPTLTAALADWATEPAGSVGVIALLDNRTQVGPFDITVPAASTLVVVAGAWPQVEDGDLSGSEPTLDQLRLDEHRPHLLGDLTVTGGPGGGATVARGRLLLDGMIADGDVVVGAGDLGLLRLGSMTIVPGAGALRVAGNPDLAIVVDRSITGSVEITTRGPDLTASRSIVDGVGGAALDAAEAAVHLDAVTVIGAARCRVLQAGDCLFTAALDVTRAQEGCLRFSYVDDAVRTPPRYRCQPDLALEGATDANAARARLVPQLVSTRFGDPGYALIADRSADELKAGSSQRSDVGSFSELLRPQRLANVVAALDEYLPFGILAGVIPVT